MNQLVSTEWLGKNLEKVANEIEIILNLAGSAPR